MTPRGGTMTQPRRPILLGEREDRVQRLRRRRWRRRVARWVERASRVLGLRRTIRVDGVRYRERTRDPLRRSLTRAGGGVKEYDVRFPPGPGRKRATMRIRCTPERMYADVGPTRRPALYGRLRELVRPGMRVFELGCGTGAGTERLGVLVGPSGGVVAVDRDRESIRFARQRYLSAQLGFEIGWTETLAGELDGAFEVVVAIDALIGNDRADFETLTELWRVVGEGGRLIAFQRVTQDADADVVGSAVARACEGGAVDPAVVFEPRRGERAAMAVARRRARDPGQRP